MGGAEWWPGVRAVRPLVSGQPRWAKAGTRRLTESGLGALSTANLEPGGGPSLGLGNGEEPPWNGMLPLPRPGKFEGRRILQVLGDQNDVARSGEMPILTFPDRFMQCLPETMNALHCRFISAGLGSNVASPAHLPVAPGLASRQNDATQSRKPPASQPSSFPCLMRHTTRG